MKTTYIPKLSNSTLDFSVELEDEILTIVTSKSKLKLNVNIDKLKALENLVSRAIKHHIDLGNYSDGTSIQIGDNFEIDYGSRVTKYYIDYNGMWKKCELSVKLDNIKNFIGSIYKNSKFHKFEIKIYKVG